MIKFAEIRERASIDWDEVIDPTAMDDRVDLLDLVTRQRDVLVEVVGSGITLDDARLKYLTMQIDRDTLAEAIELIAETET